MERTAVIIWGLRNSGKTTTIKHLLDNTKALRNRVYKIRITIDIEIEVFIQGESPSEKDQTLEELLVSCCKEGLPDRIIVAEQINGKNAGSTLEFLIKNKYRIAFFVVQMPGRHNATHWDYNPNNTPDEIILNKRAEDIRTVFYN